MEYGVLTANGTAHWTTKALRDEIARLRAALVAERATHNFHYRGMGWHGDEWANMPDEERSRRQAEAQAELAAEGLLPAE